MQPVPGHPYVLAAAAPGGWTGWTIQCHCRACGDTWTHPCQFPEKTTAWIARYAAQHAHGAQGVREHFAAVYDAELHRLHLSASG